VEAALNGNDEAFIRLVTKHKRRVAGLAARFFGTGEELDDICQDVFMKVYYHLKAYKKKAPFEHWLTKIAVNTIYDALRRKKLAAAHTAPFCALALEVADSSLVERQAAEEAYQILSRALAKLRAPERLVITLLELEERSVREVADLTGWSKSNVKVRAFRARRALKNILEDDNRE
jgi:RNA polymerase sigma-70 factor (ECF subfamily)